MRPTDYPLALIPLFPLAGALLNLLLGKRLGRRFVFVVGVGSVVASCVLGWFAAYILWRSPTGAAFYGEFYKADWLRATELVGDASLHVGAGLLLDRLSAVMVLVITTIGALIHVYSTEYMGDDPGVARYFGYLNLFTGAMLILVLGDSLPVTFVGWEGVGLCSYLLIGFWFTKEANAFAGRKAFIVNRVGDLCFLLGMFVLFTGASTLKYDELSSQGSLFALRHALAGRATYATAASLLLFVGATGKSAQLPLYVWLPDAMAGPTPVSALIHAATMVTAGVYMVARLHFLFELDPFVLGVIAVVGALTALFAATIGITQRPIKKILAYSTISQLGFMFIGVGTASYTAGMFHLVTHAVFKAGLFLGAGSIMHALGNEEDVLKMGGLRRKLPTTHWTFLAYCLAIAGIFPFAGFFSKDAILAGAFEFDFPRVPGWPHWLGHAIFAVGLVAAACTAFYMFRAYCLIFHGRFRGDPHVLEHAHESPWQMSGVLAVLGVGSIVVGFLGVPEPFEHLFHGEGWNLFERWLVPATFAPHVGELGGAVEWALMGIALVVSLAAIALAWALYHDGVSPVVERIVSSSKAAYRIVYNKYYVDELYDLIVVRPLRALSVFLWKVIDSFVIDLVLVRGSATVVDLTGQSVRYLQNGDVQRGVVGVMVGAAAFVAVGSHYTAWRAARFTTEVQDAEVTVRAQGTPSGPLERPLIYEFDFGDGAPVEQTTPVATHHFDRPGRHKIVVEVIDPRWHTRAKESRTIEIGEIGGAP